MKPKHIETDAFVRAWQRAKSPADVARLCKQSSATVSARASFLRKRGINLKRFGRGGWNRIDVPAINRLTRKTQ
jgi:hypothetical protein